MEMFMNDWVVFFGFSVGVDVFSGYLFAEDDFGTWCGFTS